MPPVISQVTPTFYQGDQLLICGSGFGTAGNTTYICYDYLTGYIDPSSSGLRKQLVQQYISGVTLPPATGVGGRAPDISSLIFANNFSESIDSTAMVTTLPSLSYSRTTRLFVLNTQPSSYSPPYLVNEPKAFFKEPDVRPTWRTFKQNQTVWLTGENLSNGDNERSYNTTNVPPIPNTPGSIFLKKGNSIFDAQVESITFENAEKLSSYANYQILRLRQRNGQDLPEGTYDIYTSQDTTVYGVASHGQVTVSNTDETFTELNARNFTYSGASYSILQENPASENSRALLAAVARGYELKLSTGNRTKILIPEGTYYFERQCPLPDDTVIHGVGKVTFEGVYGWNSERCAINPDWRNIPLLPTGIDSRYRRRSVSYSPVNINNVTNATPYVVNCSGHGLSTLDTCTIAGVTGHEGNPNGLWTVGKIDANNFFLSGSISLGASGGAGGTSKKTSTYTGYNWFVTGDESMFVLYKNCWIKGIDFVGCRESYPGPNVKTMTSAFMFADGTPNTVGNNSIENCSWLHKQIDTGITANGGGADPAMIRFVAYGNICSGTFFGLTYPGTEGGYHFRNEVINCKSEGRGMFYVAPNARLVRHYFDNLSIKGLGSAYGLAGSILGQETMIRNLQVENSNRGINQTDNQAAQWRCFIVDYNARNNGHNHGGGEQILWENYGVLGTFGAYNSGVNSLTLTASKAVRPGFHICITDGQGKGQYRRIIATSGSSPNWNFTLDRPFLVAPDSTSKIAVGNYITECHIIRPRIDNTGKGIYFYGGNLNCRVVNMRLDVTNNGIINTTGMNSLNVSPSWYLRIDSSETYNACNFYNQEVFLSINQPYSGVICGGSLSFNQNELVNPYMGIYFFPSGASPIAGLASPNATWPTTIQGLFIRDDKYDIDPFFAHGSNGSVATQDYAYPRKLLYYPWNFQQNHQIDEISFVGEVVGQSVDNSYYGGNGSGSRFIWGAVYNNGNFYYPSGNLTTFSGPYVLS